MANSNLQSAVFESEQLINGTEFSLDINDLRDELQDIEEELEEVEEDLEEIEDALEAGVTDSALEELEDEVDELEEELEEIEEDLDEIDDALEAAPKSSQVKALQEEVEELEDEVDDIEEDLEEIEAVLDSDDESDSDDLDDDEFDSDDEADDDDESDDDELDDESDADVEALEDEVDEIEDELEELEEDLEEIEDALESSPDADGLEDLEEELEEIEDEFEELEEDLEEVEDALEALPEGRDVAELEEDIEDVEAELEEFETEIEAIEKILEANDGADHSDDSTTSEPILPEFDAAQFKAGDAIDNPYFPLPSGSVLSYSADIVDEETGETSRESNQVFATFETKTILGVDTQVIRDRAYENGVLVEDTADWYAQDVSGNVWYMGELAINYEYDDAGNLTGTNTDGSWEAGVDGAKPGYLMPANPQVGDRYYQEFRIGEAEDQGEVISLNESVTIGLNTYDSVLKTRDFTDLEPGVFEFKYYAPGVGQILAEEGISEPGGEPEASPELIHVAATTSRMEFGGAEADVLFGSNVSEVLDGDRNDDFLFGNGGQDVLVGGMGDDVIFGGAQADTIFGGAGDDLIYANGGGDWISSGSGLDQVWLGSGPATIRLETGEGYASIQNFQLGSTQLRVSDVSQLSFSDTANGVAVFQGSDQIAEVAWQSAETFTNNLSQIF